MGAKGRLTGGDHYMYMKRVRPRVLDGCCCEGSASFGLYLAGYNVDGLDIKFYKRYPFAFRYITSILDLTDEQKEEIKKDYVLLWMSPPCQAYCKATNITGDPTQCPAIIPECRALAEELGIPYILENVKDAGEHMKDNVVQLDGTMFDLRVKRIRLFETSDDLKLGVDRPSYYDDVCIGMHSDSYTGPSLNSSNYLWELHNSEYFSVFGSASALPGCNRGTLIQWRQALMGKKLGSAFWMTGHGLAQSVPVPYAEYLGRQMLRQMDYIVDYAPISYDPLPGQNPHDA